MKFLHALFACALVMVVATTTQAQVSTEASKPIRTTPRRPTGSVTGGTPASRAFPTTSSRASGTKYLVVDVTDGIGPTGAGLRAAWLELRRAGLAGRHPSAWGVLLAVARLGIPPHRGRLPGFYNDFLSIDVVNTLSDTLDRERRVHRHGHGRGRSAVHQRARAPEGQLTYVPEPIDRSVPPPGCHAPVGPKRAIVDLSAVPVGTPMTNRDLRRERRRQLHPVEGLHRSRRALGRAAEPQRGRARPCAFSARRTSTALSGGPDWSDGHSSHGALPFPDLPRPAPELPRDRRGRSPLGDGRGQLSSIPASPTPFGQINVDVLFRQPVHLL